MTNDADIRRKRLLYQAQHRGFKEADLLIGGFAAECLAAMDEAALAEFEAILAYPDHDLFVWLKGDGTPPADIEGPVFEGLKAFDIAKFLSAGGR
ncbi:MAG: succinate dehydrogenase assembly factor 2 [Amphiplicatus sp.]